MQCDTVCDRQLRETASTEHAQHSVLQLNSSAYTIWRTHQTKAKNTTERRRTKLLPIIAKAMCTIQQQRCVFLTMSNHSRSKFQELSEQRPEVCIFNIV